MTVNHKPTRRLMISAVIIMVAGLHVLNPSVVLATDDQTVHATACTALQSAIDSVIFNEDGLESTSTSSEWVYCPIVRDSIAGGDVFDGLFVYVHDGNDAVSVYGYGYTMDSSGTTSYEYDLSGSAFTGDDTLTISAPDVGFGDDTLYFIRLSLPAVDAGVRSGVYGYVVIEPI